MTLKGIRSCCFRYWGSWRFWCFWVGDSFLFLVIFRGKVKKGWLEGRFSHYFCSFAPFTWAFFAPTPWYWSCWRFQPLSSLYRTPLFDNCVSAFANTPSLSLFKLVISLDSRTVSSSPKGLLLASCFCVPKPGFLFLVGYLCLNSEVSVFWGAVSPLGSILLHLRWPNRWLGYYWK